MKYEVRWEIGFPPKVLSSTHESERGAKNKAREMSVKCNFSQVAAINPSGVMIKKWAFEKGKQTGFEVFGYEETETKAKPDSESSHNISVDELDIPESLKRDIKKKPATPQVAAMPWRVEPLGIAPKEKEEPNEQQEDDVTAKKSDKLIESFGARAGTNREKLIKCLVNNLNKQLTLAQLARATYGESSDELKGSLMMVIKGTTNMIEGRRLPVKIVKEKNDKKEITIGLHTK